MSSSWPAPSPSLEASSRALALDMVFTVTGTSLQSNLPLQFYLWFLCRYEVGWEEGGRRKVTTFSTWARTGLVKDVPGAAVRRHLAEFGLDGGPDVECPVGILSLQVLA